MVFGLKCFFNHRLPTTHLYTHLLELILDLYTFK